jgi:hypothetical protein
MPQAWKLVLIGGEVTVLAAFTGLGMHLVMQPHRFEVAPPPLLIPSAGGAAAPRSPVVAAPRPSSASAPTSRTALNPDLLSKFGRQDRGLMNSQWDILRRLIGAMEQYLEHRVVPAMEGRR